MSNCSKCNCSSGDKGGCSTKNNNLLIQYNLKIEANKNDQNLDKLQSSLIDLDGIESISIDESLLKVFYDDVLISPERIENEFKDIIL